MRALNFALTLLVAIWTDGPGRRSGPAKKDLWRLRRNGIIGQQRHI